MNALAHEADFDLGAWHVSPSIREVACGARRELLEPRVMQVLVALKTGHVLSRDDLIARCWDGRIVGNDAIDRVIGKLRRLSERDGGKSVVIETIPRVGYRLRAAAPIRAPRSQSPRPRAVDVKMAAMVLEVLLQSLHVQGAS
jgi:DNA-binding winged helix-turn-helix (wHTH) protein